MSTEPSAQSVLIERHRDEIIELVHQHRARSIAVSVVVISAAALLERDIEIRRDAVAL
jgi:hypothetical protein